MLHAIDLIRQVGILLRVFREPLHPVFAELMTTFADSFAEILAHAVRNQELCILGPAVELFCQPDFVLAQRFSMRCVVVLLVRRTVADVAVHNNERRAVRGLQEVVVGFGE